MGACLGGGSSKPAPKEPKPVPIETGSGATAAAASTDTAAKPSDNVYDGVILQPIQEVYDIGREIGTGGFSVVHEATSRSSREKFAVKIIKKQAIEGDDIKLLKREIQIMKQLNHPNILKLFEVYEDASSFYLVLELVQGKELFDKIVERGQYSEKDAAHIVRQILSAVSYLHQHDIAHRALKPENLLSAGSGDDEVIKIADFGFSKNFGEEKLMTSCGSPGYVAPEVLTCDQYDKSVDMWSVGVILYILLCGYPPFYADNAPALFKKIMEVQYDFDDPSWEDVSNDAKNLIRHLLVREPSARYTAEKCLQDPWVTGTQSDKPLGINSALAKTIENDHKRN